MTDKDVIIVGSVDVKISTPEGKELFSGNYTNPSTPSLVDNSTASLTAYGIDVPEPFRHAMEVGITAQEAANQTVNAQEPRKESGWSINFGFEIPRYEGVFGKTEGGKFNFSFSKTTKKR